MRIQGFVWFITVTFCIVAFSQQQDNEILKAQKRLVEGKELYLSVSIENTQHSIDLLNSLTSLDRIEETRAYLYANKEQFAELLNFYTDFKVEPHPGELIQFECSDYKNHRSTPKFTKWPSYDGYVSLTKQYETDNPDLCKVIEIGDTPNKHKILGIIFTNQKSTGKKSRFFQLGGIHGDELTGTMLSYRMLDYMIEQFKANDPRITKILDSTEIHVWPFFNLDGTYKGGNTSVTGAQRGNASGVDLNRSFPGPANVTPQAKEQPETRLLMDFLKKYKFTLALDFHGGIEAYLLPWCGKNTKHPDDPFFRVAGNFLKSKTQGSVQVGTAQEIVKYVAPGCLADYYNNGVYAKGFTLELSTTKLISESQFDTYYNKYREMLLSFYEYLFMGIQGVITDSTTNKPIEDVKVFVENHDSENSWVYSYENGGYYRLIDKGSYNLTFSHDKYVSRTISSVSVQDQKKTELNVKLFPKISSLLPQFNSSSLKNSYITQRKNCMVFTSSSATSLEYVKIYSMKGTLLKELQSPTTSVQWDFSTNQATKVTNGCYVVRIKTSDGSMVNTSIVLQNN